MKTLAEMGRLYDSEDEAKMTQLTEDLTLWINKYASTFDDPEHLLFEVTSSLISNEMTEEVQVEEPVTAQQTTSVSISFTFSDNNDWFIFEQTNFQQDGDALAFDFGLDNAWFQMTQDLNSFDDWGNLSEEEWNNLIDYQYLEQ